MPIDYEPHRNKLANFETGFSLDHFKDSPTCFGVTSKQ